MVEWGRCRQGQSKALVLGTWVTKVGVEVRKGGKDKDAYMEGGGILPPVNPAG